MISLVLGGLGFFDIFGAIPWLIVAAVYSLTNIYQIWLVGLALALVAGCGSEVAYGYATSFSSLVILILCPGFAVVCGRCHLAPEDQARAHAAGQVKSFQEADENS
jgi:hypothetical protein